MATIARGQFPLTIPWYFPDTHRPLHSIKTWGPGVVWTPGLATAANFNFYAFPRLFSKHLWLQFSEINKSEMLTKFFLKKVQKNILSRLTPPIFPDISPKIPNPLTFPCFPWYTSISLFSRNSGHPETVTGRGQIHVTPVFLKQWGKFEQWCNIPGNTSKIKTN